MFQKKGNIKQLYFNFDGGHSISYPIYSIKGPGRLLTFWTLRVGAYSRWALIRGWALIKFSPFLASSTFILQENTIYNNKT